jgi:hypothetical protein
MSICRKVLGDLTVANLSVSTIRLETLQKVTGSVYIIDTGSGTEVTFSSLREIQGSLKIGPHWNSSEGTSYNTLLTSARFYQLEKIGGDLEIFENPALEHTSFNFSDSDAVGGAVTIQNNPNFCPPMTFFLYFNDPSDDTISGNKSEEEGQWENCYHIPMSSEPP